MKKIIQRIARFAKDKKTDKKTKKKDKKEKKVVEETIEETPLVVASVSLEL